MLSQEARKEAITSIVDHFATERNEQIGVIAAEAILDACLQTISKEIYNKGLDDAKELIKKSFENIDFELDASLRQ